MKKLSFLIATALCIMACSGGSDEQPDGPGNGNGNGGGGSTPNPVSFSNPIVGKQLPDPTIIHAADGNFYLYVTQQDNIYILETKLLQKSEMQKDIVIELSYKGFS